MSAPDVENERSDEQRPEQQAETGAPRPTPGDPALKRSEKEEIDRYVEWQHDPATEYLPH